jgi:hypothetical protein
VRGSALLVLIGTVAMVAACASTPTTSASTEPSRLTAPSPIQSDTPIPSGSRVDATATAPAATQVSGVALPACASAPPKASQTITFIASGHAWALDPSGTHLTCLFAVTDPGPFEWGPLGDRALLAGLEVKGVAGGPSRLSSDQSARTTTWSRPTGTSIVYVPTNGASLKKIHLDGTRTQDVTPLKSSRYLSVTYHPSGEAFAFALEQDAGQSIWMSSNIGKTPKRLVFSSEGTTFGALGFDVDGRHLLYAAGHADGHPELHRIDVTDTKQAPVVWEGPVGSSIMGIEPGLETGTVAWTSGTTSCADSVAMAQIRAGTVRAVPDAARPTRAVGWVSRSQLLVATGGCGEPFDLSVVDLSSGSVAPLVSGVSAGAVRTQLPTPPAPLPKAVVAEGSGFS